MSLAFLYPGQGSQRPDMLRALPASPAVTRTLDEAALELDHTRWPAGLDDLDTAEALQSTTNVQLALLISGVAAARALTDDRGLVPAFVAGHSVGAFAAAVTAGVLTFAEAMSAVRLRGDLMQQICSSGQWGMAAVLGLRSAAVGALADRVTTPDEPVWIANINAADQIVLSGSIAALERAKAASRLAGARRWEPLDVTIASHCPLQKPTAERMAAHPGRSSAPTPAGGLPDQHRGAAVSVLTLARSSMIWPRRSPGRCSGMTRCASCPSWARRAPSRCPPGNAVAALLAGSAPSMYALALEDDGIERAVAAGAAI